jgi:hypothetical protein
MRLCLELLLALDRVALATADLIAVAVQVDLLAGGEPRIRRRHHCILLLLYSLLIGFTPPFVLRALLVVLLLLLY